MTPFILHDPDSEAPLPPHPSVGGKGFSRCPAPYAPRAVSGPQMPLPGLLPVFRADHFPGDQIADMAISNVPRRRYAKCIAPSRSLRRPRQDGFHPGCNAFRLKDRSHFRSFPPPVVSCDLRRRHGSFPGPGIHRAHLCMDSVPFETFLEASHARMVSCVRNRPSVLI
jgi:hypothetical protein